MKKLFDQMRITLLLWTIAAFLPVFLALPHRALAVSPVASAGDDFSIVLKSDGTGWGWGKNLWGQLNDGTGTTTPTPVQVFDLDGASQLSSGEGHTAAVKPEGTVWSWGANFSGALGGGHAFFPPNGRFRMVANDDFNDARSVMAGGSYSLVLDGDDRLWAWGRNNYGQLGEGTTGDRLEPVLVSGMTDVAAIGAGTYHATAVKIGGAVWTWGRNTFGQLGDGTSVDRSIPVQVVNITDAIAVSAGLYHSVALKSNRTVWAWGYNGSGQLGDGSTTDRMTPVRTGDLTDITMIAAGAEHALALKSNGSVWAWGSNYTGQIGDGTTTNRPTPVQINDLSNIIAIAAGSSHSLAIDEQGRVWQWGSVWITSNMGMNVVSPQLVSGPDSGGYLNVFEPSPVVQEEVIGAWAEDLAINTFPYDQLSIGLTGDHSGGSYIVWDDEVTASVWAQRVDPYGQRLWGSGRLVASATSLNPRIAADGTGGILVAWQDGRNGWCSYGSQSGCDIYAQRIDGNGQPLWQSEGVPVVTAQGNQSNLSIVGDGQGGAIVVWQDPRQSNCCRLFAQRISADGQIMWQADGILVSPEVSISAGPMDGVPILISDDAGGALLAWLNNQVDPIELTVQRISADGLLLWELPGTVIGTPSHTHFFKMTSDGAGGAIVAYSVPGNVQGSPETDIRAQRVLSNGTAAWQEGGVWVSRAPLAQINPQIVGDGAGGAIVAYQHEPDVENAGCFSVYEECDIFAQRINAEGNALWTENGIPISAEDNSQHSPILVADGGGGAVVAWQDCRRYPDRDPCINSMDIYVQRVSASGDALWPIDGAPLTRELGNQGEAPGTPLVSAIRGISDSRGGATFAWPDGRRTFCAPGFIDSNCDVFVQRVIVTNPSDTMPMPVPWVPLLLFSDEI